MIIRRVLYTTDIGERNNWDVSKTYQWVRLDEFLNNHRIKSH